MAARWAWTLVVVLGLPIGSYLALGSGVPSVWVGGLDYMLGIFVVAAICFDLHSPGFPRRLAMLAVVAVGILVALAEWRPQYVSYLPPMVIIAGLVWVFLDTLRPGREPLITQFARQERGGQLPPELAAYTRRLTWFWTVLFAALFSELWLLALFVPVKTYLLFANSYNYLAVAAFFVLEYLYRRVRYRRYSHASPLAFVRLLMNFSLFGSGKQS
jgi:uncharacterized membrane protein